MRIERNGINVKTATVAELKDAISNGVPLEGLTHITTHAWPHLDEIAAIALVTLYGDRAFPGLQKSFTLGSISDEAIKEMNTGNDTWYELLRQGHLVVGTGGGPLDDHHDIDGVANKQNSATELVAEFLGIEKLPEIQNLIRYIGYEDNNGDNMSLTGSKGETGRAAQQFMLATTIKRTWRVLRETDSRDSMISWIEKFVQHVQIQVRDEQFYNEEIESVLENTNYHELTLMTPPMDTLGTPVIAVTEGDSEYAVRTIMSKPKGNLIAVLQINPNGRFQFFPFGKKLTINQTDDIVRAIRSHVISWKNYKRRGPDRIKNNWSETSKEGTHPDVEGVHYFRRARMIFNGSHSQPDTVGLIGEDGRTFPFTKDILVRLIAVTLQDKEWPEQFKVQCSTGSCPASEQKLRCKFYTLGLTRCRTNRRNAFEPNEKADKERLANS